ncbi:MAG: DEAD/DEAH box helicase [Clostridia bacterium]|nr:DEAD/DEAH box helicase [Clostridia bacterium]
MGKGAFLKGLLDKTAWVCYAYYGVLWIERTVGGDGMISLASPVTALAGIGPKKGELFQKLGILTVGDLLRRIPRAYQNRGDLRTLAEAGMTPEPCAMLLTVASRPISTQLPNRKVLTKFQVFDETGKCDVVFFNQNYIKDAFALGATYRFWGKLTYQRGRWSLPSPQFEPYDGVRRLPDYVPVYPLGAGVSQKMMRSTVGIALASLDFCEDVIPEDIRMRVGLLSLHDALYTLHNPQNPAALSEARRYFIFEELFLFALSIAQGKREREGIPGYPIRVSDTAVDAFLEKLPFTLTPAQSRVIGEIRRDLASGCAMHRLVSGDVGSGKTVIAAFAAYLAVAGGYQAAMMAPTEILARQHYAELAPLFASLGKKTALLIGATKAAEKKKLHEALKRGEIDFVIGTHALLSNGVGFCRPAVMITDEQHRFGV